MGSFCLSQKVLAGSSLTMDTCAPHPSPHVLVCIPRELILREFSIRGHILHSHVGQLLSALFGFLPLELD